MIVCEDCGMMDGGDGDGKRNNKRKPMKYETDYEREKLDTAPQLDPLGDGFWEQLNYYLYGRKENGIYYDKEGTPISVAPVTGMPPDFFGPGKMLNIGKFVVNANNFHRVIKPKILKAAGRLGNFQKTVGKNPDIIIENSEIILRGTGPFRGKIFKTGLDINDFFP